MEDITEQAVLDAVETFAYDRFGNISFANDDDFSAEDEDRIKTDKQGYIEYTIDNLEIKEKEDQDGMDVWYVSATIFFDVTSGEPIEGSTDVYQAYMGSDGKWCVDWHSS